MIVSIIFIPHFKIRKVTIETYWIISVIAAIILLATSLAPFNEVISSLTSDYASKIAIDGMFKNKLIIVPPNMKLNRFLIKIVPSKIILDINSQIQEKRKSKEEN